MHDRDLLQLVIGSAHVTLPLILEAPEPLDSPQLDVCDVEVSRTLARALADGGTSLSSLEWTAEVLEVSATVMTHHRVDIPDALRQPWSSAGLLLRTAGGAFGEAVGRLPGTTTGHQADVFDVTNAACAALGQVVSHAAIMNMIASLGAVLEHLPYLDDTRSLGSTDVERILEGLRLTEERFS